MTAPAESLAAEWSRLELLGACLLAQRRGEETADAVLRNLTTRQDEVRRVRASGAWDGLTGGGVDDRDLDLLAVALVPAVSPRAAALFAAIVPTAADGSATVALAQELFALDVAELVDLTRRVRPESPLVRRSLVQRPTDSDPRRPLLPCPGVLDALLGHPETVPTPPGSIRVHTDVDLAAVVAPAGVLARLDEFVTAVRNHGRIAAWGARPIGGPVALFAGPSGVGKSLAARAVAGELDWPLFRVDLSQLVDKYIGETEKNFTQLFDAAHGRPLVLHFEEAESLFGKRGEIREARDRYANLEVSHLLSRIESHDGPCILSTNLRRNLDVAFLRRFHSVVEFPRPTATLRAELWQRLLPDGHVDDIDLDQLARVDLSGGEIHNAAVAACLLASGRPPVVGMGNLAVAVWRELGKDGRPVHPGDLGPLAAHLPAAVAAADDERAGTTDRPGDREVVA